MRNFFRRGRQFGYFAAARRRLNGRRSPRLRRRLPLQRAGLVAGLLMAVSPIEVQFAQEARPYALASCMVMLALWGQVRIVKHVKATPLSRTGASTAWAAYLVCTIAALNLLLVGAFWLLASNLDMAATLRGTRQRQLLRHWLLAQLVIVITWRAGLPRCSFSSATALHQIDRNDLWCCRRRTAGRFGSARSCRCLWCSRRLRHRGRDSGVAWRLAAQIRRQVILADRAHRNNDAGCDRDYLDCPAILDSALSPLGHRRVLCAGGRGRRGVAASPVSNRRRGVRNRRLINLAPYYRNETKARWTGQPPTSPPIWPPATPSSPATRPHDTF